MHKFFVPEENIFDNKAVILGNDVKHIYKVLRLTEGTEISINNCKGQEYLGEITSINKNEVKVELKEKLEINNESKLKMCLFQGLPKTSKMDLIVQKNCELGIREITPIITERVVVRGDKKIDRLKKIALESSKQCKRSLIPKVNSPIKFSALLQELKNMDLIVVPYENQENFGIKKMMKDIKNRHDITKIAIIIGPEGGFEEEEINSLKDLGAYIVTLGPRILRTETAGFTTVSLLMYELGDLGGKI